MQLDKYLTNNSILIIPDNLKVKTIKYLNSLNEMYNIKIMTFKELAKHIQFDYDVLAINYIMKKQSISYENAKELIENMYYIFDKNYTNNKLNNLKILKDKLVKEQLLIEDTYFKQYIKNKDVFVFGFDYINKYYLKLIDLIKDIVNIKYIPKYDNNYTHQIYNFEHLNYEIEFIANDIINNKLNLNNVYIYGMNKDNETTIKRIFNNYNLNINTPSNSSLYETKVGYDLLLNLDNVNEYIASIKDNDMKDLIIDILNKYYWEDDKNNVKDMLEYELKTTMTPTKKYTNAINCTNLFDDYFTDNDYIYVIDFNAEYIPKNFKDTDYINDSEKFTFLETTPEKNNIEKNKWFNIIKNIKNLCLTSANQNLNSELKESSLIRDFNYKVINVDYKSSNYSNKSNIFNLGILLDNFQKYSWANKELENLLATYPNHNYLTYDNSYQKVILKDDFKFNLSYSKMNTYYECSFKYYWDNILKLNMQKETFDTWTGNLCHFILSKIYDDNFNYENIKQEFISNHPFDLTNENKFFLNKILSELTSAIDYIKSFQRITKYQTIETEKKINVEINNTNFIGIIDKIMSYENNYVLIDYKTGIPSIDLKLAKYGLNLQLPTYIYLIRKIYPESKIIGIYLQHILKPVFNKELEKSSSEQYEKSLRLAGYTLGNEALLQAFDPTYENSEYISGMKLTSNGFSSYSKVLTDEDFNKLESLTEEKINECIINVKNAKFNINPKIVGIENISCEFCPYKSVCYKTEKDLEYIKVDNNLTILGGDNNELD